MAKKGIKLSKEHKKKLSEAHKNRGTKPPSRKGTKISKEHKQKIRDWNKLNKDKFSGENNIHWKGGISQDYYRRIAFENFPNLCEICGSTNQLRVHHKNKNRKDNNLDNLMIVCKSCHNKIHEKWKNLRLKPSRVGGDADAE